MTAGTGERDGHRGRAEDGAVAVEFAIIMVVLFLILFGIIEFGIAFSKLNVYTGAAREGARYAAVDCAPNSSCTMQKVMDRVKDAAAGYPTDVNNGTFQVTVNGTPGFCTASTVGAEVKVSWDQTIQINIPFAPGLNPATITRTIQGVFRCETGP